MPEQIPRPMTVEVNVSGQLPPELERLPEVIKTVMDEWRRDLAMKGGAVAGEFPEWDRAAWKRLEAQVGPCRCKEGGGCPSSEYMLMHHEPDGRAGFKHRQTRQYTYV